MSVKYIFLTLLMTVNLFALKFDSVQKEVFIEAENGGYAKDGSKWGSSSIKDKVYILFYIDPDERTTNEHFSKILKKQNYNHSKFGTIAIVNLAATWKPNFIIEKLLKSKQKEFPDTIYVKDKNSVLVKEWSLQDDSSEILLFSKESRLLFYKSGKMTDKDIKEILSIIDSNIL